MRREREREEHVRWREKGSLSNLQVEEYQNKKH